MSYAARLRWLRVPLQSTRNSGIDIFEGLDSAAEEARLTRHKGQLGQRGFYQLSQRFIGIPQDATSGRLRWRLHLASNHDRHADE
jgi:hypothetical protein